MNKMEKVYDLNVFPRPNSFSHVFLQTLIQCRDMDVDDLHTVSSITGKSLLEIKVAMRWHIRSRSMDELTNE